MTEALSLEQIRENAASWVPSKGTIYNVFGHVLKKYPQFINKTPAYLETASLSETRDYLSDAITSAVSFLVVHARHPFLQAAGEISWQALHMKKVTPLVTNNFPAVMELFGYSGLRALDLDPEEPAALFGGDLVRHMGGLAPDVVPTIGLLSYPISLVSKISRAPLAVLSWTAFMAAQIADHYNGYIPNTDTAVTDMSRLRAHVAEAQFLFDHGRNLNDRRGVPASSLDYLRQYPDGFESPGLPEGIVYTPQMLVGGLC